MKKQSMYMRMITASLARRRSRMVVALLAIVVGATVLSGLVTVYYDMPRQMGMEFRNYGANMIVLPDAESDGLAQKQIDAATAAIPADKLVGVSAYHYESMTVNSTPIIVAGADLASVQATSPYWYVTGEWPDAPGEVLVGKEESATYDLKPGDTVTIAYSPEGTGAAPKEGTDETTDGNVVEKQFSVVGTLDTGGNEESYFFISTDDMSDMIGSDMKFDVAELSIQASSDELEGYAEKIEADATGVSAELVKRVSQSETTVLSKLQALVFLVTVIVLALTMICVATTMTAVVTERRKEIGLRKALGAPDKSIMLEFMGESLLLGAIGGLIGSGLGFAFAQLVSHSVFNSVITFRPWLIPISIIVALVVTALASFLPVRRATTVDPAVVLKGE